MKVFELTDRAVLESSIANKRCFACGGAPSTGIGEHVIPKWLQTQCNLFDKRLTLLNGTSIPYRKLTVPCCVDCNTGFLSTIEAGVQPIFHRGSISSDEEKLTLGRWLSKILIGILVKETSLLLDRSKPSSSTIVPPSFIDELQHCHFVMQSARKPTSFRCIHSEYPFSLYAYTVSNPRNNAEFDLSTNLAGQSVSIRIGQLGVIFINDGGFQMEVGPTGPFGLLGAELSRTQFREISARVHYKAALRDATHSYLTFESDESIQIEQLNVRSFSGYLPGSNELQIFRDWNETELSYAMSGYMAVDRSIVFDEAAQVCRTSLIDQQGKLIAEPKP
ncbi:hypothetical protein [Bradyrhizobium sp. 1(2017)]|uniref:hypothetical protein n=1 Tax=Bradyrhizobium sp. 1(2017) TaxID=1404888 RepID=UPI00140EAFCE|nr:hypothetical protein [Bradyrhizobium sp. 1(2017)]QIO33209.1 hypothetical protein HAP40_16050 [Bradyrhizobium sp. 1(2017)]